jgi:hypothetical protein
MNTESTTVIETPGVQEEKSQSFLQSCSDAFTAIGEHLGLILDEGEQLGELKSRLEKEIVDIEARLDVAEDVPLSPDARERELGAERGEKLRSICNTIEESLLAGQSPAEILLSKDVRPTLEQYYPSSKVLRDDQKANPVVAPEFSAELAELGRRLNRRSHEIAERLTTEGEFFGVSEDEKQLIENETAYVSEVKREISILKDEGATPIQILTAGGIDIAVNRYYPSCQRQIEKKLELEEGGN